MQVPSLPRVQKRKAPAAGGPAPKRAVSEPRAASEPRQATPGAQDREQPSETAAALPGRGGAAQRAERLREAAAELAAAEGALSQGAALRHWMALCDLTPGALEMGPPPLSRASPFTLGRCCP